MPATKRETCDTCGKRRKVRFSNILRAFCSADCANTYLKSEGLADRVFDPEKTTKTPGKTKTNVA